MAWFYYSCNDHGKFKISLDKREKTIKCPQCDNMCYGVLGVGGVRITEILDNGVMPRAVERDHDIEELVDKIDFDDKMRNGMNEDSE